MAKLRRETRERDAPELPDHGGQTLAALAAGRGEERCEQPILVER
jgi:hypothetical protein